VPQLDSKQSGCAAGDGWLSVRHALGLSDAGAL
jgi:hypothetical protein